MNTNKFVYLGQIYNIPLDWSDQIRNIKCKKFIPAWLSLKQHVKYPEIARNIYCELIVPAISASLKYFPFPTQEVKLWDQMIYNTLRKTIGELPIKINKNGLYTMLNIISLEEYNLIVPACGDVDKSKPAIRGLDWSYTDS